MAALDAPQAHCRPDVTFRFLARDGSFGPFAPLILMTVWQHSQLMRATKAHFLLSQRELSGKAKCPVHPRSRSTGSATH